MVVDFGRVKLASALYNADSTSTTRQSFLQWRVPLLGHRKTFEGFRLERIQAIVLQHSWRRDRGSSKPAGGHREESVRAPFVRA